MQRRRFFRVALAAAGVALTAPLGTQALAADDFPTRPIRLIVPYGAGGVTDQVTRALADAASRELGQAIVVENKPGVSGTLGATQVGTAEPDGYTLSMAPVVIFRLPHVQKMRYDPLKDLTYISMIADYNFAVAVKKDAIPGFINEAWTKIEQPGIYRGQCAELCGRDHGFMPIVVEVKTKDDYQAWLKGKQDESKQAQAPAAPAVAQTN